MEFTVHDNILDAMLSGTADLPIVAPLAITNTKLANMTGLSQLKGSNGLSTQVTDILLGTGLSISGSTLNATGVLAPNAGNTQFGLVSRRLFRIWKVITEQHMPIKLKYFHKAVVY